MTPESQSTRLRGDQSSRDAVVVQRYVYLLELGFSDKVIGRIFDHYSKGKTGIAPEVVDAKLAGLKERGFNNPRKMIESSPSILGLALDNIDAKLAGLEKRNFKNPHKMIESFPNVLSYSFNNIDRKLRLLNKLVSLYQLPYSANEMMEWSGFMFSTKIDKMIVLSRVLTEYQVSEDDLPKMATKLIFSNLENVLIALSRAEEKDDINALFKRITEIRAQGLDRQQKREIIREELDEFPKIARRYLRGYPQ